MRSSDSPALRRHWHSRASACCRSKRGACLAYVLGKDTFSCDAAAPPHLLLPLFLTTPSISHYFLHYTRLFYALSSRPPFPPPHIFITHPHFPFRPVAIMCSAMLYITLSPPPLPHITSRHPHFSLPPSCYAIQCLAMLYMALPG